MPSRAPDFRPPNAPGRSEKHKNHDAKRPSASRRGYDHTWRKLRMLVLHEQPLCQAPGCAALATEVDHITPLSRGGTHARENLQALCKRCHSSKTAREDRRSR
jgi:5-methylcytosine-specific restriction protein A